MGECRKVRVEAEIDRGFSLSDWRKLEETAIAGPFEASGIGDEERDWDIVRVDYSILNDLKPDDSIFIGGGYGTSQTRSAALGKAKKRGWSVVTRKTYENDTVGVRIFRLS